LSVFGKKKRILGEKEERTNLGGRERRERTKVYKNYSNIKRAIYMPEYYPIFLFYKKKLYFTFLLNK